MRDFAKPQAPDLVQSVLASTGLAIVFGALLAWMAPFSSDEADGFARLGYWTSLSATWLAISGVLEMRFARSSKSLPLGLGPRTASILITTAPMTVMAGAATAALSGWRPDPAEVAELCAQTLVLGSALSLASAGARGQLTARHGISAAPCAPSNAPLPSEAVGPRPDGLPLAASLAAGLPGEVQCLQMEDHYVRLHLRQGSALTLMRMSDAVLALGEERGLRVHRSWWVAHAAVERVVREGRGPLDHPDQRSEGPRLSALFRQRRTVGHALNQAIGRLGRRDPIWASCARMLHVHKLERPSIAYRTTSPCIP